MLSTAATIDRGECCVSAAFLAFLCSCCWHVQFSKIPGSTYWWCAYMGNAYKRDFKEINQRSWSMWHSLFLRRPSKQCTTLLFSRTLIIAAMFGRAWTQNELWSFTNYKTAQLGWQLFPDWLYSFGPLPQELVWYRLFCAVREDGDFYFRAFWAWSPTPKLQTS